MRRILVISPHIGDGEFGSGGTINRFAVEGNDTHQDHYVVYTEGFRAFKMSSILGYEMPRNNRSFKTGTFVFFNEGHMKAKMAALNCFQSMKGKLGDRIEFREYLAMVRGGADRYEVCRVF